MKIEGTKKNIKNYGKKGSNLKIFENLGVRENERGAKSQGVRKIEVRKSKAGKSKGRENLGIRYIIFFMLRSSPIQPHHFQGLKM